MFGQQKKEEKENQETPSFKRTKYTFSITDSAELLKSTKTEKKDRTSGLLSTKSKKERSDDEEFKRIFKLPQEILFLLKTFTCTIKTEIKGKGTLYITQNYMCFCGDNFGRRMKEKFYLMSIKNVTLEDSKYILLTLNSGIKVILRDFENTSESFDIIFKFWDIKKQNQLETFDQTEEGEQTEEEDGKFLPSNEEWKIITEGTRSISYNMDEFVITQGVEQPHRLYQISLGRCRIEKTNIEGQTMNVGYIGCGDLFGELAFLEGAGGRASASVVAHEKGTVIDIIEGYYLDVLFEYYTGLSGRFYHQIGSVIANRLKERQIGNLKKEESESEVDVSEDKSEVSEKHEEPNKKNSKRTLDLDKKGKNRRKSGSRTIIEDSEKEEKNKKDKKDKE